jgi:hypothetical protein
MKEQLLTLTRKQLTDIAALQRAVRSAATPRMRQSAILSSGVSASRMWFDEVRPALERAAFQPDTVSTLSSRFEALLRICQTRPMKSVLQSSLADIHALYRELVHNIEIGSFSRTGGLSIAPYIEGLPSDEGEYLDEAQRCLSANALRGCIVLGWCATIARIHSKIADLGYDKFNKASEEMAAKTVGRYKPFNKKFSIDSLSELQRVFDTDLLWMLEYLSLIDGNQHQRLRHCFEFRNNSAHPGLAPITGENLYSFFSDITQIVLKNPNFEIKKPAS